MLDLDSIKFFKNYVTNSFYSSLCLLHNFSIANHMGDRKGLFLILSVALVFSGLSSSNEFVFAEMECDENNPYIKRINNKIDNLFSCFRSLKMNLI